MSDYYPGRAQRPRLAVVHLVRSTYGTVPFEAFVDSYRRYRAGIEHDLILLLKGFKDGRLPPAWRTILQGTRFSAVSLPDIGMDIPSYFQLASRLDHEFLCFVNTWSVLLAEGWLASLFQAVEAPRIAAAGATGAWWSLYSVNLLLRQKAASKHRPPSPGAWSRIKQRVCSGPVTSADCRPEDLTPLSLLFRPFPNPFLRTNGFLIRREEFLSLEGGRGMSKLDALAFESGINGMTRQLVRRGREVVVVGRDGRSYGILQWPTSRTYRSGGQENLLISDNRTELYSRAGFTERVALKWTVWGGMDEKPPPLSLLGVPPLARENAPFSGPIPTG